MRAAVYTRLSVADDRATYERQLTDCETAVTARGWSYDRGDDWHTDYGRSAWQPAVRRDRFEAMLGAVADGRYQVVVAWKVDRLCRSHRDLSRVTDLLDRAGAALVLVTEGLDASTPMGRFGLEILTSAASLESANTSMRVRSAQQHMVSAGRHRGGPVPYGWQVGDHPDGPGTWLHAHPAEAEVVREMVTRVTAGESALSIAHDLNRRRVPTRKGGGWTDRTVLSIVRSPRLVGWQPYTPAGSPSPQVARDADGDPIAAGDPLVDLAAWRAAVDACAPSRRTTTRSDTAWLSGVATCGLCGSPMHSTGAPTNRSAVYQCSRRRSLGPDASHTTPVSVSRRRIEAAVDAAVRGRLDATGMLPPSQPTDPDVWDRIAAAEARLDLLDDRWAAGEMDDRRHARLTAALTSDLDAARARAGRGGVPVDPARWESSDGPRRRRIVQVLLAVDVQPHLAGARTAPWRVALRWVDGKTQTLSGL